MTHLLCSVHLVPTSQLKSSWTHRRQRNDSGILDQTSDIHLKTTSWHAVCETWVCIKQNHRVTVFISDTTDQPDGSELHVSKRPTLQWISITAAHGDKLPVLFVSTYQSEYHSELQTDAHRCSIRICSYRYDCVKTGDAAGLMNLLTPDRVFSWQNYSCRVAAWTRTGADFSQLHFFFHVLAEKVSRVVKSTY